MAESRIHHERHHQLMDIFGEAKVSCRETDRIAYARDQWPRDLLAFRAGGPSVLPDFIVWPETLDEIGKLLRLANERRFPVIPFGGGVGNAGGARPIPGAVVLDMKRMDRVLEVSDVNLLATVETGIIGQRLEDALAAQGYTLGHFPGSMYAATLGGFLASRSVGQLATKYGRIADLVVSLVAVLPDGSVFRTRTAPRSATGPNLNQVLLGTHGTLAVIVQATLRIKKAPAATHGRAFVFADVLSGLAAMRRVLQTGVRPAVLRLHDEGETARVGGQLHLDPLPEGCLLIVSTEGSHLAADLEIEIVTRLCQEAGGRDAGEDPVRLWRARRYADWFAQSPGLASPGSVFDMIEVAARWSRLPALYRGVRAALAPRATCPARFTHATPETCSVLFTVNAKAQPGKEIALHDRLWRDAATACREAGGQVASYRGSGLPETPGEDDLAEGRRFVAALKKRLDPHDILNPGKRA
jgi:alkyldihydroxyacetonephosphate synthase